MENKTETDFINLLFKTNSNASTSVKEPVEKKPEKTEEPQSLLHYDMGKTRRKKAVIFYQKNFFKSLGKTPLTMLEDDCKTLNTCLSNLNIDVKPCVDYKLEEISSIVNELSRESSKDVSCVMIFILTYGCNNMLYASDKAFSTSKITEPFTSSQTLAGVPKLFFIQTHPIYLTDGESQTIVIPKFADILWVQYPVAENVYLIKTLCDFLNEDFCSRYHILKILTLVNKQMMQTLLSNPNRSKGYVEAELPHYKSTMTKILQLVPSYN